MANDRVNITSPVGRYVMGNLYDPETTGMDGQPLTTKTGPNAGQPRTEFFFVIAVPKAGENHWAFTEWGKQIWEVGHRAFPQAAQSPQFHWKIKDGDSTIPNQRNLKPIDNEGWRGCWILKFKGGFAPKIYRQENGGFVQVLEREFIKPGYFVQVAFSVDGNANQINPGVYLNPAMVCFRAYGPEIVFGLDVNNAGFGAAPLPAGASMAPPAGAMPALPGGFQAAPPAPGGYQAAAPAPPAPGAMPALPGGFQAAPVMPNPQFLQVPAPGVGVPLPAAGAIPAPPANVFPSNPPAPTYRMTAKAQGSSREAFLAAGWTDAQLIQQGMMTM